MWSDIEKRALISGLLELKPSSRSHNALWVVRPRGLSRSKVITVDDLQVTVHKPVVQVLTLLTSCEFLQVSCTSHGNSVVILVVFGALLLEPDTRREGGGGDIMFRVVVEKRFSVVPELYINH